MRSLHYGGIQIPLSFVWTYEVRLFFSAFSVCANAKHMLIRDFLPGSCSLGCTQSHKIYCTPKPHSQPQDPSEPATATTTTTTTPTTSHPETDTNGHTTTDEQNQQHLPNLEALGKSPGLQDLLRQHPQLRDHLRDIYKTTLEEEWVEIQAQPPQTGRGRPNGRGGRGGGGYRNRGPWTREKGFNRGLGKVRKYRERCEDGLEIGKDAEGFMRFVALVEGQSQSQAQEPA